MSLVILQPASNDVARTNYAKTVKRPADLERVRTHVPELHKQLLELYPEGAAPIWGVKARNRKPWGRIQRGDVTLFARDNGTQTDLIAVSATGEECVICSLKNVSTHVNTLAFNLIE